ncbi:single-strand binding protein [Xylanimonas cellulosilytica DSM 15894]|uniref:Single-stranded DNA-binding protein n=1 Tax=Xylanimonas cellulosilytica (strain DSM 15894 / JCM 12276 / CECT 5975 / KCTC 9989 / LMG 20990 / NBRC 107835 / XIL07) TaxID=446471 RepID=D1BZG5_XYLCX|nr:single-stranded DNA-binding protein [Xylanimonas cellulosilytica]ACZ30119.1 single-strand binding protein [Xylanimonas cellulosilytica DSM 15894]
MSDVSVTVVGHVGQDPHLFASQSGTRWTSIRVASTRRVRDPRSGEWGDGPTMWFTVRAFGDRALNLVESVRKGTPVVVTGRLAVEEYEVRKQEKGPDGEAVEVRQPRWAQVIENASVGVDLSRGVARFTRTVHTDVVPGGAPAAAGGPGAPGGPGAHGGAGAERGPSWEVPGESAAPDGAELEDEEQVESDARETVGV